MNKGYAEGRKCSIYLSLDVYEELEIVSRKLGVTVSKLLRDSWLVASAVAAGLSPSVEGTIFSLSGELWGSLRGKEGRNGQE